MPEGHISKGLAISVAYGIICGLVFGFVQLGTWWDGTPIPGWGIALTGIVAGILGNKSVQE